VTIFGRPVRLFGVQSVDAWHAKFRRPGSRHNFLAPGTPELMPGRPLTGTRTCREPCFVDQVTTLS